MANKYGVTQWGMPDTGLYAVRLAAEAGLDGVQLELGSEAKGYPLTQPRIRDAYLEAAAKYNIEYPSINIGDFAVNSYVQGLETPEAKIAFRQINLAIDTAHAMQIPAVMLSNFWNNFIRTPEHFDNTVKALQYACDYADQYGITILNETILSAEQQLALFEQADRKNLQLLFDSMNYWFFADLDQMDQMEKLFPIFSNQIHFKDGTKQDLSSMPLGTGGASFYPQIEFLKKQNYQGWYIIENFYNEPAMRRHNETDPISLLIDDLKILKEALGDA